MKKLLKRIFSGFAKKTSKQNSSDKGEDLLKMIEAENKQLLEYIKVEDTPFHIVKHEQQWYVLFGKFRMNQEPLATKKQALAMAHDQSWDTFIKVIQATIEHNMSLQKLDETIERQIAEALLKRQTQPNKK